LLHPLPALTIRFQLQRDTVASRRPCRGPTVKIDKKVLCSPRKHIIHIEAGAKQAGPTRHHPRSSQRQTPGKPAKSQDHEGSKKAHLQPTKGSLNTAPAAASSSVITPHLPPHARGATAPKTPLGASSNVSASTRRRQPRGAAGNRLLARSLGDEENGRQCLRCASSRSRHSTSKTAADRPDQYRPSRRTWRQRTAVSVTALAT
jgi:hypothetical protein